MERETWSTLTDRLEKLPDWRPPRAQFTDRQIVMVFLWAVLHDRPISWACRPEAWPRRRELPSPSTMTRRLRKLSVMLLLLHLTRQEGDRRLLCIDGKPLRVSRFSKDKQARRGYGAGGFDRGYKLHAICDRQGRLLAFDVRPMNEAECVVGKRLITRAARGRSIVLGDASYDTNALHAAATSRGATLLAPRRKPGTGLGHKRQHPARLKAIETLENNERKRRQVSRLRSAVERYFGWLTAAGGGQLPPWVRTLPRVRRWVIAKVAIHAAMAKV